MSNLFGDIFTPGILVQASANLLEKWFPLYLTELEDRLSLRDGELKVPTNYAQRNTFSSLDGEELPKCVILVPGLSGPPQKSGGKIYRAPWRLGIGVAIAAPTEEEALFLSQVYGAAVRAIFVHHPSINGTVSNLIWTDESYDDLPVGGTNQQFRAASVWFSVDVDNVVNKMQGPPDPVSSGPNDIRGTADTVEIQIDKFN